jgi:hypothetical protein
MEPLISNLKPYLLFRRHSALFSGEISYCFVVGCLTMLSVASGHRMTEEWRFGNDLKGNGCGVNKVISDVYLQVLRNPLKNLIQGSRWPSTDLNPVFLKYKYAGIRLSYPTQSIYSHKKNLHKSFLLFLNVIM